MEKWTTDNPTFNHMSDTTSDTFSTNQPTEWWQGRNDGDTKEHLRWHQTVQAWRTDISHASSVCFLGFAVDEGVRRNKGRQGAQWGPQAMRQAMSSFPILENTSLWDAGNIYCLERQLETAQVSLGNQVAELLAAKAFPVLLGGGHEMAWGHYQGIRRYLDEHYPGASLGVVNIDAHFDLRKPEAGNFLSSGTSFWHMWQDCQSRQTDFHYLVLGIQKYGNTEALFQTAAKSKTQYVLAQELTKERIYQAVHDMAAKVDFIYLTLCLDALGAAYAPGVSAPNPLGITPYQVRDILEAVHRTNQLLSFDIAELNPRFDIDGHSAKLAAQLIFELLSLR